MCIEVNAYNVHYVVDDVSLALKVTGGVVPQSYHKNINMAVLLLKNLFAEFSTQPKLQTTHRLQQCTMARQELRHILQ